MNIKDIEESIIELENGATTFDNAIKLASLYILKENLKPPNDMVGSELQDIFPQYRHYVETRRNFQLGKISEKEMLKILTYLCQEIKEFLEALYASTSSAEERRILITIYKDLDWSP